MRIAVVCANGGRVGGTESYLGEMVDWLVRLGHDVAMWYEVEAAAKQERVAPLSSIPQSCVAARGVRGALADIAAWGPDVISAHGLYDRRLEWGLLRIAPVVLRVHNYYGTCISGAKTWMFPRPRPCHRRFGLACVAYYYPRRCGGWSAATMASDLVRQWYRRRFARRCAAVVANSEHMAREFIANGVSRDRVCTLPPPGAHLHAVAAEPEDVAGTAGEYRLLFLGRLVTLKGGDLLLASLPAVRVALGRPIRVTFAGNGPARDAWEKQAKRVQSEVDGVTVEFVGWADDEQREALWKTSHLLVVPSVWPEPFGLVGLEAARHAIPAAAFDVGGISEWLTDGVNGRLARGRRPLASHLADAIVGCLRDDSEYRRLRQGALESLSRFDPVRYAHSLVDIFHRVAATRTAPPYADGGPAQTPACEMSSTR